MDARENIRNGKNAKEITSDQEPAETFEDPKYDELQKSLQASTQNTVNRLDMLIQSSGKRSSKRLYLELFRALVVDSARSSESLLYLFEYVTDLRASILLLSLELEHTRGKTFKDVKKIKSKLDSLLNSPAMVEIGKVLQNIQRLSEEPKGSKNNPCKDYLR
jgi:hypothetical protein